MNKQTNEKNAHTHTNQRNFFVIALFLFTLCVCVWNRKKNVVYLRKYEIDKMVVFRIFVFNMYISYPNSTHKQASERASKKKRQKEREIEDTHKIPRHVNISNMKAKREIQTKECAPMHIALDYVKDFLPWRKCISLFSFEPKRVYDCASVVWFCCWCCCCCLKSVSLSLSPAAVYGFILYVVLSSLVNFSDVSRFYLLSVEMPQTTEFLLLWVFFKIDSAHEYMYANKWICLNSKYAYVSISPFLPTPTRIAHSSFSFIQLFIYSCAYVCCDFRCCCCCCFQMIPFFALSRYLQFKIFSK